MCIMTKIASGVMSRCDVEAPRYTTCRKWSSGSRPGVSRIRHASTPTPLIRPISATCHLMSCEGKWNTGIRVYDFKASVLKGGLQC